MRRSLSGELTFGVVSGDPLARVSLRQVCEALTRDTGHEVRAEILPDYAALPDRIAAGRVHIAWSPPLVVQRLSSRALALPIGCPRRLGGLSYHSVVFSSAQSSRRRFADLQGTRAAWVDVESLSGCVLARRWCEKQGRPPAQLFAHQAYVRTHSAVARAVLSGEADVGATYANVEPRSTRIIDAGWSEIGAIASDVRVLATIGPVPPDAIVVSNMLPITLREAIGASLRSLTGAAQAAVRALFRAECFDNPDAQYLNVLSDLNRG